MNRHNIFIIAEAGVNHNGSVELAKKLVDAAVKSEADAVKFQTFKTESLVSRYCKKAEYQKYEKDQEATQFKMLKRLELDIASLTEIMRYCKKRGIIFLSSPFDLKSIDLLKKMGLNIFKIPSGEITNLPYLRKIGSLNKKIIMSTGMSSLNEIKMAMDALSSAGTKRENIIALHCNTAYPTPMQDVNLKAMLKMKEVFGIKVGYSDHTLGIEVPIAAAALGASVIEKHFTLDRNMEGPDHKASLEPGELEAMVKAIRNIEIALGSGVKRPSKSERKIKKVVRKSIVAKTFIAKGAIIRDCMLAIKRPGTGIESRFLNKITGKRANKNIKKDVLIKFKDLV